MSLAPGNAILLTRIKRMDGLGPSKALQSNSNKSRGGTPLDRGKRGGRGDGSREGRGRGRGSEDTSSHSRGGRGGRGGKRPHTEDVSDVGMALNGKVPPSGFKDPRSPDLITFAQSPRVFRNLVDKKASVLTDDSIGLRLAAKVGNLAAVKLFTEAGANPAANNNEAIYWAAENGYDDIVSYLMQQPNTNPSAVNNRALAVAKKYKHKYVIEVLESDCRVTGNNDTEFEALDILYPTKSDGAYSTVTMEGPVVRKRLTNTERDDKDLVQAAADEAAILRLARSAWPYVPEVLSVDGDTIAMSRAPGESYEYLLLNGFDKDVLRAAVVEAVTAIATVGIRHHDLSPPNLHYHNGKAWILDFGLATMGDDDLLEGDIATYDDVVQDLLR